MNRSLDKVEGILAALMQFCQRNSTKLEERAGQVGVFYGNCVYILNHPQTDNNNYCLVCSYIWVALVPLDIVDIKSSLLIKDSFPPS